MVYTLIEMGMDEGLASMIYYVREHQHVFSVQLQALIVLAVSFIFLTIDPELGRGMKNICCCSKSSNLILDRMVSSKFKLLLVICHDESRTGGWTLVEMICRPSPPGCLARTDILRISPELIAYLKWLIYVTAYEDRSTLDHADIYDR
jgi:hypothetical protein